MGTQMKACRVHLQHRLKLYEEQKQPTKPQGHFKRNSEKENSIGIVSHINSLKNMVVYTQNPSSQDKGKFEANLHYETLSLRQNKTKAKYGWTETIHTWTQS